ncbi:MAG: T9SS type A sorting domain-containing protein [Bacteroidota bacterium]
MERFIAFGLRLSVLTLVTLALVVSEHHAALAQQADPGPERGRALAVPAAHQATLSPATPQLRLNPAHTAWDLREGWAAGAAPQRFGAGAPAQVVGIGFEGRYPNNAEAWLTGPMVTVPSVQGQRSVLRFEEAFEIESHYDAGTVLVSPDGVTWRAVSTRSGASDWRTAEVDLTRFAGQRLHLAFRLTTDDQHAFDGWYLGDVRLASVASPTTATITSLNAQLFPSIFLDVVVEDANGDAILDLAPEDFCVFENGVQQTDLFDVTLPDEGGGVRLVDIVFIIDNSGSLGDEQAAVEDNVTDFVNDLADAGVNFALGLTRYGASANGGNPIIENGGNLTTDENFFLNTVYPRNTIDGSFEPGFEAIVASTTGYNFRPGAQRVFIIVTDETPFQGPTTQAEAQTALVNTSTTLFSVVSQFLFPDFQPLTDATDGELIDILDPFDEVFDFISNLISDSYRISYRSSDPVRNGIERTVRVEVKTDTTPVTDVTTYTPGAAPTITRTPATIALSDNGQLDGVPLTIEAEVVDTVAPLVQAVTLFYRTLGDLDYTSTPMANQGGDLYQATIPGTSVRDPFVEYYITATDSESTVSAPATTPGDAPFQIAVLPNQPPNLTHTPVTSATDATAIPIQATASDNTMVLVGVSVFYRRAGQISYTEIAMTNTSGDAFSAEIPASEVTPAGVEYYVRAVDDFSVGTSVGTVDAPIVVEVGEPSGGVLALDIEVEIDESEVMVVGTVSSTDTVPRDVAVACTVTLPDGQTRGLQTMTFIVPAGGETSGMRTRAGSTLAAGEYTLTCDLLEDGTVLDTDTVSFELSAVGGLAAYPNPFNPSTEISFALEASAEVSLVVYDVLGRQVMRLHDGALEAGEHRIEFDASRLASGFYLARLQTGDVVQVEHLVLLK